MDQSRLDALTRFVGQRTGRRTVAAGALGGLVARLIPGWDTPPVLARKAPRKQSCKKAKRRCGKRCVDVKTSRTHCGKCHRRCKKGHVCYEGRCTPPCGKGGPCRVFVTSSVQTGNMGGLAGADAICNRRARAAKLPGRYKAWLSDETASPLTRFTHNTGPYVLINGKRIANNWADLTDGTILAPIRIMENGRPVTQGVRHAWTSTMASGAPGEGPHCNRTDGGVDQGSWTSDNRDHWTIRGGDIDLTDDYWSGWGWGSLGLCSIAHRLYCFQQS